MATSAELDYCRFLNRTRERIRQPAAGFASEYPNSINRLYGRRFPAAGCRVLQFREKYIYHPENKISTS
jgi:hypothetical protein